MYRASIPHYITPEGEKFEDYAGFRASSTPVITTGDRLMGCGTVMTQGRKRHEILTTKAEYHTFVIGETGSGKTRRVVLPTIRLLAKSGQSMVITDPKGELYRYTAAALKAKGYDVKVINLKEPLTGNRYNPLSIVDKLYHSDKATDREEAIIQLKDILSIATASVHSEHDKLWENGAADYIQGLALLILEYGKKGDLTFSAISALANSLRPELIQEANHQDMPSHFRAFIADMDDTSPIKTCMNAVLTSSQRTLQSYLTVIDTMLSIFSNQSALMDGMSASDFSPEQLGKRAMALFLIFPDYSDAMYALGSLYINQIYAGLVRLADSRSDGALENRVSFLLDEFANFAPIPDIASKLTAARSRGISYTLICQSMEQLISKYSENGAEIIMANCRVWLYMNCRNLPFLNRLVELCGKRILPDGNIMPLVTTAQLLHLRAGEIYIINDRCHPYRGYLPDYSEYNFAESDGGSSILTVRKPLKRETFDAEIFLSLFTGRDLRVQYLDLISRLRRMLRQMGPACEDDLRSDIEFDNAMFLIYDIQLHHPDKNIGEMLRKKPRF